MAKLSITEASNQFSVGRSTLYRHIKMGRITVHHENGLKYIDSSEMVRVYRPRETGETVPVAHHETPQRQDSISTNERAGIHLIAAQNEIKFLKNHIELLQEQINRKDELLSRLTRLLPQPKDD